MARISMPNLGPLNKPIRFIRRQLPPLNFITIHYLYFILTCLLSALVFWGSSTPFRSVSFTNSLFLTVSAMTEAGLNTVNLSELNTFQQFILFLLIMLGSGIWVSAFVVHVRLKAFQKKFLDVESKKKGGLSRVKTWATSMSRGKSKENVNDEERGETVSNSGKTQRSRDATPPARRGGPEMNEISSDEKSEEVNVSPDRSRNPGITFRDDTQFGPSGHSTAMQALPPMRRQYSNLFAMQGVGARPFNDMSRRTSLSQEMVQRINTTRPTGEGRKDISRYLDTVTGWIGRNSQFHGLSDEEREHLGGCEYRAVQLLAWLVPVYFVLWQLIGCIGCGAWVALNAPNKARANGLNPWWVGAFNAVSAFNNSGMSLLDANMVAFQKSYYMLITMSLLILAGNTAFPIFLRLIVWSMLKIVEWFASDKPESDPWSERAKTLQFLLDHPRRCYTNLFPSQHTWWLAASVFLLNGVDWAFFEILNIGNTEITAGLALRYRVIDGLFQAFAVRSGGFYVVTISALRISLQVLYVVMMYISVYPVVITIRNSNVYEERSLGIYSEDEEAEEEKKAKEDEENGTASKPKPSVKGPGGAFLKRAKTLGAHFIAPSAGSNTLSPHESNAHFVRQQLRAQLAHDAWWIVFALFLIMICEGSKFKKNPAVFSVFNFIFEIVSAYGCVGISVGVPWAAYSFSGSWDTLSKLILCAVMLRGRHRGLPVAIDKAVLLPSENHALAEEEDGLIKLAKAKTMSRARTEGV